MGALRRSRHNVYRIFYHYVTPVKYRKGVFEKPEREDALRTILKGIEERYDIWFLEVGMDKNHVHWVVSAAPKYSPSELIRVIKSLTAREMFRMCPDLQEELWGGELWTDGFYVATVGEHGSKKAIMEYVARQGKQAQRSYRQMKLFDPRP